MPVALFWKHIATIHNHIYVLFYGNFQRLFVFILVSM